MEKRNGKILLRLVYSALCLSLCVALPQLVGRVPELGKLISPMHLPAYLAGLVVGPCWGLLVGAVAPILNFLLYGRPVFVSAFCMIFELGGYAFFTGLFYRAFPKKVPFVYLSLALGMLLGRVLGGVGKMLLLVGGMLQSYSFSVFWSGYFASGAVAMLAALVIVPPVFMALRRAHLTLG